MSPEAVCRQGGTQQKMKHGQIRSQGKMDTRQDGTQGKVEHRARWNTRQGGAQGKMEKVFQQLHNVDRSNSHNKVIYDIK